MRKDKEDKPKRESNETWVKCFACGKYYTTVSKLIDHIAETGHKQR